MKATATVRDRKNEARKALVSRLEVQINELRDLHRQMQEVVNDLRETDDDTEEESK